MNIITGCLAATEGEVKIDGLDIFEDAAKAKKLIGYLPELPPLYLDMTPREYLTFVGRAKGVAKEELKKQVMRVMGVTEILDVADRLIKNLSKGYRQRVGVAQTLLGDPEIIIMDEPTVGLDPKQIIEIRDLIKKLGKDHTVILSSHILSEVRAVCDSVIIISKGRLVASDTLGNIESQFSGNTTYLIRARAGEREATEALRSIPEVTDVSYTPLGNDEADIKVFTSGQKDISERIFFAFGDIRKPILSMNTERKNLEDVFIELTNRTGASPASGGKGGRDK